MKNTFVVPIHSRLVDSVFLGRLLLVGGLMLSGISGGTSGKIRGRIVDEATGEALIGCNIVIDDTDLGAATDLYGNYVILNIPPGEYSLTAMMIGYRSTKVLDVAVSIDFTTVIDVELLTSVIEMESVIVIALAPIIKKDLTSSKATISAETISRLPVESFEEVLELQAGIVRGSDDKIHIRGGRASEVVYLIDGISVNDPFSSEISVAVENDAIQELQVVSGTFNAEYGQAMSGVVNIVTKEGGQQISGEISGYLGDYVSSNNDVFANIDEVSLNGITNVQASLGGAIPRFGGKLTLFTSGRYYADQGWLYGQRLVTPGRLEESESGSLSWGVEAGDSTFVAMNSSRKLSGQAKLTYKPIAVIKLSYGVFWSKLDKRVYDHLFRFNPDGDYRHFKDGLTQILTLNHTLSSATFYTFKISHSANSYKKYVFEDPLDPNYVNVEDYKGRFYDGGTKLWHIKRSTSSINGKLELTSQMTINHQVKTGLEFRGHQLKYEEFKILLDFTTGYLPRVSEDVAGNVNFNDYVHHPLEAAAYFQDKMEFADMILNAGIRLDYFDPAGKLPTDPRDPDNAKYYYILNDDGTETRIPERSFTNSMTIVSTVDIRDNPWVEKYEATAVSWQVSPRIGIAYPISDMNVLHFSYGHFSQIPPFKYLYYNSEFEVRPGPINKSEGKAVFDRVYSADPEAEGNIMGNAGLQPQQTVIYELGLQQQISENIGIDITGFYKDMRNLLGTEIVEMYDTRLYARYINRDLGNIRGITVALHKRATGDGSISVDIDYTYQAAKGNASDPNDAFLDAIGGRESDIRIVPLDWDQTHTLNTNFTIAYKGNWGMSILGKFGTGLPYTYEPSQTGTQYNRFENNERKPARITFDLNVHKAVSIGIMQGSVFLKVYNLLDRKNEIAVYNDTGRAGYTIRTQYWGEWVDIGTVADWVNRPHMYSQPRRIMLGFSLRL